MCSAVADLSATRLERLVQRLQFFAPVLLLLSLVTRLAGDYLVPAGANLIDLHVYVGGAAALDHPGTLYSYVYSGPDFAMPFTYPPFAALVFYPLHLLPFGVLAFTWRAATIAALYGAIRVTQHLGATADSDGGSQRAAMLWTAVGIWVDPVRNNLDLGQVNVFLMLAVLWAGYTSRGWFAGLLVGLAAGIKLTPAITGIYFVGVRRWSAAVFSALAFVATIAASAVVDADQTRYYFTSLLGDAHRIGPVGSALNQSWRGGLSRILGHDAGSGLLVLGAIIVTAILAILAWRALDAGRTAEGAEPDLVGKLLVIQLCGLLISPISWTPHWVWLVPLMVWLIQGPLRRRRGAQVLGWGWLVLLLPQVPWTLTRMQHSFWEIGRPWYLAWAGLIYIAATLVTLSWIALSSRRTVRQDLPDQPATR